jgi:COP9 signalosome complex subunit 1
MHLSSHVRVLLRDIRNRALVQYCKPFSSVRLPEMAQVFGTTIDALEVELASLIEYKKINARLDSFNKVCMYVCMSVPRLPPPPLPTRAYMHADI